MFGRKKEPQARSVIGAGTSVTGPIAFSGSLHVDGIVIGDLTAAGLEPSSVVLGSEAHVEGGIHADRVRIAGTVIGPVIAHERLELRATARVQGNVQYHTMEMQPGATVAGEFQPRITPPPQPEDHAPEPTMAPADVEPTLDTE